ncbi:MAG: glycosyltransferase [Phycisphaeraceae bacterium]|nr:MAG: glycosyltransferase [Phycisphaeraceae bacterium]
MAYPPIVIVQDPTTNDHFPGVADALRARGHVAAFLTPANTELLRLHTPSVVVVKETQSPLSRWALREAHLSGATSVLLMDGVLEYRNTFHNPFVESNFLHPALAQIVACSGPMDEALLKSWGNDAVATGLPRIHAAFPSPLPTPPASAHPTILIATANKPAFNAEERSRLLDAMLLLQQELHRRHLCPIWRLTGGLEIDLGVQNDTRSLRDCLADAAAVLTTPSTLAIEAMTAGRPTMLIHPHPGPLWQRTPWVWRNDTAAAAASASPSPAPPTSAPPSFSKPVPPTPTPAPQLDPTNGLAPLLDSVLAPTEELLRAQARDLALQHGSVATPDTSPADVLADLLADLNSGKRVPRVSPPHVPAVTSLPARLPRLPGKKRVVNCVACDGSPVGGVMTWALRLARSFASSNDLGYDVRTLVVVTHPGNLSGDFDVNPDGLTEVCALDPMSDPTERLEMLVESLRRMEPDIILPNYGDICHMAASRLTHEGVRTIAIAHSDEPYYRDLASTYSRWSAAVAVSAACESWLAPLAKQHARPIHRIVYGVPVAAELQTQSAPGPLKLAYIGRMVEIQKRISDFLLLIDALETRGVTYELHMIGDGHDMAAWTAKLAQRTLTHGLVRIHGRRDPAWVERFLPTMDISVLLSEFEGTSVTMLEAMGASVVPAVTRVRSGVDEWLTDGESGVVVPIGAVDEMADRLAALWHDRNAGGSLLSDMGRRAWERVRDTLSLDNVASKYCAVFDAALAEPLDRTPSDAALRIMEPWQWLKPWNDDPAAADAYALQALRDAGYKRIARGRPASVDGLACDAVLVRAFDPSPTPEEVATWRASGLGVALSPMLVPTPHESHLHRAVLDAIHRGRRRIAIYGTGRHTRDRHALFIEGRWPVWPFVGFIDDKPPAHARLFGLPIVSPAAALEELEPDAIVLSSDVFEEQLWKNAAPFREAGIEVIRVYTAAPVDNQPTQLPHPSRVAEIAAPLPII